MAPHPEGPPLRVLLVEDNPADVLLIKRTLQRGALLHDLTTVTNGVNAMNLLRRQAPYHDAKTQDLILLDLNLPGKSGMEVLAEVKADPLLKITPVIILTSSATAEDVIRSYALGANSYLRKPSSLDGTFDLVRTIEHFWMSLVVLPTRLNGVR